MNSRRKFLIQGGIATTGMLVLKPFQGLAGTSTWAGTGSNSSTLVFFHTTHVSAGKESELIQSINQVKNNHTNTILLHAGKEVETETGQLTYDVSAKGTDHPSAITGEYKIVRRGNIKTGVISVSAGEDNVIEKVNTLSAWLKKEKGCAVVVCLSQLGYRNKHTTDDIALAKASEHLDIIIGGDNKNFPQFTMIELNNKNAEVIIHSAADTGSVFGKIEIDFNESGLKKHVSFC